MKKIILTTIILAIFMVSIASAGVFEFVTGNPVAEDKDGDGCMDTAKCNFLMGIRGSCTAKCLYDPADAVIAANCPMYLSICQSGLATANDNLAICEADLDICDVALQQCQAEVCECPDCEECPICEECRDKYCVGDWELDTYINLYLHLEEPMTHGNNDEVVLQFINVTNYNPEDLTFEIDNELDVAHLPETPLLTSADTLHIVVDTAEGIYLPEYRYDVSMGSSTYTDEIWLWFNNGDSTMFGGDPSYEYVTVFYKNGASVEWFGSQTLDVGSEDLFMWMTSSGYSSSFGLADVTPDEIVVDMVGSYGFEMDWALDNGDFSHLGELPTTDDPCELELTT